MLGAQQSLQHGVGGHAHFLQSGFLHADQIHHLDLQVLNLPGEKKLFVSASCP